MVCVCFSIYVFVLLLANKRVLNDIPKDTRLRKYEGGLKMEWALNNREKNFYNGKASDPIATEQSMHEDKISQSLELVQ